LFLKHLSLLKEKIRFVPISTKRPSLSECSRVAKAVSTVVACQREAKQEEQDDEDEDDRNLYERSSEEEEEEEEDSENE
jgi:hypothetical protein